MNLKLISNYIFKLVGAVSLIHALIGIVLILFSSLTFSDIESADFTQALTDQDIQQDIDLSDKKTKEALSELPEIVKSSEFKEFYLGMIAFGFITNMLLFYSGYQLIKENLKYVIAYMAIMGITLLYMYQVPSLIAQNSNFALSFGAAWGIGNMGISLFLFTNFWFWGPVLLLVAVFFHYIGHNKSFQSDP